MMITKPKGCYDIYGKEARKWQYVNQLIDNLMEKYNYQMIRTPLFEATELFHRGVGDTTDIVTKETYDFVDRGERNMTLRPEGTAGVARSYIENKMYGNLPQPVKFYYNGTMYRYERPQSGRDRELTQFGVEVLGTDDPMIDAEVVSVAVNLLKLLGLKGIKVNINSLGDNESREAYRVALKEHFRPVLSELCVDCKNRFERNPLRILDCKVDSEHASLKNAPTTLEFLNEESKKRFDDIQRYLKNLEIDYEVNPRIVRGLDYYNHIVFEIEAAVEGFGSNNVLVGGGRYNGLMEMLDGPSTPGIGFACGIGRIISALEKEGIELVKDDAVDCFVMYVSDTEKEYAVTLVQELRMNGFSVDTEYTGRSLKSQFKQADRLGAKTLIILNDDDLRNNQIQIKNNITKEEQKVDIDYMIYVLDEMLGSMEEECGCGDNCNCGDDSSCGCHHHE